MEPLIGSVEAGGTKMVCAVGTGPDDIRDEVRFPTSSPQETLPKVIDYFRRWQTDHGDASKRSATAPSAPAIRTRTRPPTGW